MQIDDPFPAMRPAVEAGLCDTSVRLIGSPQLADTVEALVRGLVTLGETWGGMVRVLGQPEADWMSTGHGFTILIDGRVVWCVVDGEPAHFDGSIPDEVRDWLDSRGWVQLDPSREDSDWRLPCHVDADDLTVWIMDVVAAVEALMWPQTEQWTMTAFVHPVLGERLHLFAGSWDDVDTPDWVVNLAVVLGAERCAPVLWPCGSFEAKVVCRDGLHHLHDGPCVLQFLSDE